MIIRTPKNKENPYSVINNYGLRDPELSWKAKGLLAYLLSLPDDWRVRPRELAKHAKARKAQNSKKAAKSGVKAVYSGIHELMEAGYIKRILLRDATQRFQNVEYQVFEYPSLVNSVLSSVPQSGMPERGTRRNILEKQAFERGEKPNYDDPMAINR